MNKENYYISTIDPKAHEVAEKFGFGLEIAQYCTAWNMDVEFERTDAQVQEMIRHCTRRLLHAPFNELFPCAIDPKAGALAAERYRQALDLAKRYGARKVVIHGGYHPKIYYPQWYVEQSIRFWCEFLKEEPGVQIVLENVLEEQPEMLADIVRKVDHPDLKLCLDVGHVNAYSKIPLSRWLEVWGPHISHFHIHNNDGSWDTHSGLEDGSIAMGAFLAEAERECPNASFTLELMDAEPSARWLVERCI